MCLRMGLCWLLRVAIVFAVFVVWLSFAVLCWFGDCCLRLW